jgi:hypothetical protein
MALARLADGSMTRRPLQPGEVPTLAVALSMARQLGCTVEAVRRTGEIRVTWEGYRLTINNRRKDAPLQLLKLLRAVQQQAEDGARWSAGTR